MNCNTKKTQIHLNKKITQDIHDLLLLIAIITNIKTNGSRQCNRGFGIEDNFVTQYTNFSVGAGKQSL